MTTPKEIELTAKFGSKGNWKLLLEKDQLRMIHADESSSDSFTFSHEDLHSKVFLNKLAGETLLIAPLTKVSGFTLPSDQRPVVEAYLGTPTKAQLEVALRSWSSKFVIGCGIFLVAISLPVLGMEFDWMTCLLGLVFLIFAAASRFIARPFMMLIAALIPILIAVNSVYLLWQDSFSSIIDWAILALMAFLAKSSWDRYQRFRIVVETPKPEEESG